jgi:hypothetical protein
LRAVVARRCESVSHVPSLLSPGSRSRSGDSDSDFAHNCICRCSRMRARPRVLLPHTCTQDGWFLQPKRRPALLPRRTVPSNCICSCSRMRARLSRRNIQGLIEPAIDSENRENPIHPFFFQPSVCCTSFKFDSSYAVKFLLGKNRWATRLLSKTN